jgi:hypothetical protein
VDQATSRCTRSVARGTTTSVRCTIFIKCENSDRSWSDSNRVSLMRDSTFTRCHPRCRIVAQEPRTHGSSRAVINHSTDHKPSWKGLWAILKLCSLASAPSFARKMNKKCLQPASRTKMHSLSSLTLHPNAILEYGVQGVRCGIAHRAHLSTATNTSDPRYRRAQRLPRFR